MSNLSQTISPLKNETIRQDVFNGLLKSVELHTDLVEDEETNQFSIEMIGFSVETKKHSLSFYKWKGEQMVVEEFHKLEKGKWKLKEPTDEQLSEMEKTISDKWKEIEKEHEERICEEDRSLSEWKEEQKYGMPEETY